METVDIIKQQQEVAREKPTLRYFPDMMIAEELYCYTKEQIDTLVATIIANIGRELEARCEKKELKRSEAGMIVESSRMWSYKDGYNEAIDRTITIIRDVTGISPK